MKSMVNQYFTICILLHVICILPLKINNLHNGMWQMKKVWKKKIFKINNEFSSSILKWF